MLIRTSMAAVRSRILFAVLAALCCFSCASTGAPGAPQQPAALFFLDAIVQEASNGNVVLSVTLPELQKYSDSFVADLAQQTIRKAYFIEGVKTEVNGVPAAVTDVRGMVISVKPERPLAVAAGAQVKLRVPKKTIAVMDFEVIRGRQKEAGRVTLDGLTSALIESGQFIVVERSKLDVVLREQALSLTGLLQPQNGQRVGTLLSADLVLTGSMAETGGVWDINLRLVNVWTGQATAAVTMKTSLLKASEFRDAGMLQENFDGDEMNVAWMLGYLKKGVFVVKRDCSQGAEGSRCSLKMDFDFTLPEAKDSFARMSNMKKRDLSLYTGVEFYIKADRELVGKFNMACSHPSDLNMKDYWNGRFEIGPVWKKMRVAFEDMTIGTRWIRSGAAKNNAKAGDQVMRLERVEEVNFGVDYDHSPPVKGTVWIDSVTFYRD